MWCEAHGRDSLLTPEQVGNSTLAMVLNEESLPVGSAPARDIQLHGRQGIEDAPILSIVTIRLRDILSDSERVKQMQCGPIFHTTQHWTDTVHLLETRSKWDWKGCTLGQILRVHIPTALLDWQIPQESHRREGVTVVDRPDHIPGIQHCWTF